MSFDFLITGYPNLDEDRIRLLIIEKEQLSKVQRLGRRGENLTGNKSALFLFFT